MLDSVLAVTYSEKSLSLPAGTFGNQEMVLYLIIYLPPWWHGKKHSRLTLVWCVSRLRGRYLIH
jgi:hypothetical protein